jgi:hypothetical protein
MATEIELLAPPNSNRHSSPSFPVSHPRQSLGGRPLCLFLSNRLPRRVRLLLALRAGCLRFPESSFPNSYEPLTVDALSGISSNRNCWGSYRNSSTTTSQSSCTLGQILLVRIKDFVLTSLVAFSSSYLLSAVYFSCSCWLSSRVGSDLKGWPRKAECCLYSVTLLVFLSDLRSSLGSFTSRIPSAMLADTFSVFMLSAKPMFRRNVEKALSLCK